MMYQLLLDDGTVARHSGSTPEDAARRYVDTHRDATVVATRPSRDARDSIVVGVDPRRIDG